MQSYSWDVFPSTAAEQNQITLPQGCLVTFDGKAKGSSDRPQKCTLCGALRDYYSASNAKHWLCRYCSQRNEIIGSAPSDPTVQYKIEPDITESPKSPHSVHLFVIDTYQQDDDPENFQALKQILADHLSRLPENALIGVVSFSSAVCLHNLETGEAAVFKPSIFPDDYDYSSVLSDTSLLGSLLSKITVTGKGSLWKNAEILSSGYFLPAHEPRLRNFLLQLTPKVTDTYKPPRSTGLALLIASLLLSTAPNSNILAKVSVFLSGPATLNPGKIVSSTEQIRTHSDLYNYNAPYSYPARQFYTCLGLLSCGYKLSDVCSAFSKSSGKITDYTPLPSAARFSFNVYTGSLDQVGLYEMRPLVSASSSQMILSDSFQSEHFKRSLNRESDKLLTQSATLTVHVSKGIKILKILANGSPLASSYLLSEKSSHLHHIKISDNIPDFDTSFRKKYFTNRWHLGDVQENTAVCVLLESAFEKDYPEKVYVQFQLDFWDPVTKSHEILSSSAQKETTSSLFGAKGTSRTASKIGKAAREKALVQSFNQKTWHTVLARITLHELDTGIRDISFDQAKARIDSCLVKLTKFFGHVKSNLVATDNPYDKLKSIYSLNEQFVELPSLAYQLRKSPQLIDAFNSSPDETAVYHHLFYSLNVEDSCLMIRPTLYKAEDSLRPIQLRTSTLRSEKNRCFLILHNLTSIVVYLHCPDNSNKLKLHPSNNDEIVFGPQKIDEVTNVLTLTSKIDNKWVTPQIILTQTGHSQSRFLLAQLEPEGKVYESKPQEKKWWKFGKKAPSLSTMNYQDYYDELLSRVEKVRVTEV